MQSKFVRDVTASQIEELGRVFRDAAMAQLHPKVREWRGETLEVDLREAQKDALASLVDEGQAQLFAEAMAVLALPAPCFKSRLIEIDGVRLIAAINFRDVSGAMPYIRILRSTAAPGTISDWSGLRLCLAGVFREFKPHAVLFFHPDHVPLDAPTTGIDDHLLAAPAQVIATSPPAAGLERVELRRSITVDFYPRYQAIYEAVYVARPALRGEVRTETRESLADCLALGLLSEIFIDGNWAGVLAADQRSVMGIQGVYLVEIVLAQEVRGQRLGPAVHQRFAREIVEARPAQIVLGTISDKNPWSRRTALRAGRIEIGAWHWAGL